jgi:hypothetical protein
MVIVIVSLTCPRVFYLISRQPLPKRGRGRRFFRPLPLECRGLEPRFALTLSATSSAELQRFGIFCEGTIGQRLLCPDCAHLRLAAPLILFHA